MNGSVVIFSSVTDAAADWFPAAIAVLALAISMVALWQTHFARAHVLAAAGSATLSIYPIRGDSSKWFILSLEAPITLANPGARPVHVTGLRVNARFTDIEAEIQMCHLPAIFVVQDHNRESREEGRFAWLEAATKKWQPILILSRSESIQTVIFERRIDHPICGSIEFDLEVFSRTPGEWHNLAQWKMDLSPALFSRMIRTHGGGLTFPPEDAPVTDRDTVPIDLLNRIRISESDLPEPLFVGASFLDYREQSGLQDTEATSSDDSRESSAQEEI